MPIYEYECQECGKVIERFEQGRDNLQYAPLCCYNSTKKVISATKKPVIYGYFSEALDTYLDSASTRRKRMDELGVEEAPKF